MALKLKSLLLIGSPSPGLGGPRAGGWVLCQRGRCRGAGEQAPWPRGAGVLCQRGRCCHLTHRTCLPPGPEALELQEGPRVCRVCLHSACAHKHMGTCMRAHTSSLHTSACPCRHIYTNVHVCGGCTCTHDCSKDQGRCQLGSRKLPCWWEGCEPVSMAAPGSVQIPSRLALTPAQEGVRA